MTFSGDDVWLVAVDDDPTGCQSVSGVPIVTTWDLDTLTEVARRRAPVTFVLTNSRSLDEAEAVRVNRDVGANLAAVAESEALSLRLISRSDSTLRGHFPHEVDALAEGARLDVDGVVICPAFFEAGRFTVDNIQWVHHGGELVAARDTEFANDTTFGFSELTLAEWAGNRRTDPAPALGVPLSLLARHDLSAVEAILRSASGAQTIIVNATNYAHLATFDTAARMVESEGATFIYRTAPSFVRAAAGLGPPDVADLAASRSAGRPHGLIAVGSHTALTNAQVDHARNDHELALIELDSAAVLDPDRAHTHITEVATAIVDSLETGDTIVLTSREHASLPGATPLEVSRLIADALVETIRQVHHRRQPAWVIAKGGITSHDLLVKAFDVRVAEVLGQALAGIVPVLEIGGETGSWPYVIFPGNVGDARTLSELLDRMR